MDAISTISVDERQFLDPRWRLANLYTITDKTGRRVPFRPNPAQLAFLGNLHSANIILKARQLGFTTICCLIYLDACLFTPNTRAGVIAHRLDDAKVIFRDKIKYPYDQLEDGLKSACPAVQDSADTLTFANNSSIRVSTSMRSGTLQYLHISEFGKICAQYPEKAREIVTGALNTVHAGQFIVIESTAEGQEGAFYKMSEIARDLAASGRQLSPLDYRFHFFPWWKEVSYALPGEWVPIGEEYDRYFDKLAADGITLSDAQKAWYVKKDQTMAGDMRREYPSTPDEAFEQALEGAYFSVQLAAASKHGRIGGFPVDPRYVVNSFWDLGRNDLNTLWLHQYIGGFHRFVGYYENSGEFIGHYVRWLKDWAGERDVTFGDHYWPHDGDRESLWLEGGTLRVAEQQGIRPEIVQRPTNKVEAIATARAIFSRCQFDEAGCSVGLKRLRAYRKEWDELRGVWKDRPRHDEASHAADSFMTFALSDFPEKEVLIRTQERRRYSWAVDPGRLSWVV
jgi:hypothetical protein